MDYADGKTFLFWNRPDTINIQTEVSYTNQAGETQTFLVSPDSSSLLIPDWKPATKIFYRSTYKPERDAIDTFRVSYYDSLDVTRSEEHTSELQSLLRISYAVFCLKTTKQTTI